MASRRNRKCRRKTRAVLKNGQSAARTHAGKSGRKGRMHAKKLRSRRGPT